MGLTPLYDTKDTFFNADAARAAFDLVMKMDLDEARTFTTMVVVDTLWETIEKNQHALQRHLDEVIAKRKRAAVEVLSKREGTEDLIEELSKDDGPAHNPYYYGYRFDEGKINRDTGSGQFRAKIRYGATKPAPDRVAARLGIPTRQAAEALRGDPNVKLGKDKLAFYQEGYAQVANFLQSFQDNGLAADTHFLVTYQSLDGPRRTYTHKHEGTDMPALDPSKERIVEIEARPNGLTGAGSAFGLVSALGGSPRAAYGASNAVNNYTSHVGGFADSWLGAGQEMTSSNARLYDRVKHGSNFVGVLAPMGSKLQIAAGFGSLVGSQGPQAEKVIGPKARVTMYRYRGTERTPDPNLTREYGKATRSPRNDDGSESGTLARRVATAYMASKIPEQQLYDLNLKAGHTPPSEGVIIDKNGQLVTQAVGYGDDHYLPFNLRNLKGLKGGEYIRSRSVGGPTSEDIYTGLVTGAHRLTVVSRSGTFVVTFDDTFRGARRYNDKAGRMVNRYEKLLDAVKSEDVIRTPLEPSVKQAIRDDVERTMAWAPAAARNKEVARKEEEFKLSPRISAEDEKAIEVQVRQAAGDDEKLGNRLRSQLRNQVLESKAYNYKLNGDGYAAAIHALSEQFPYYLTAEYQPRRDVGRYESEPDKGYVKVGHNRPQGALEGYYDTSIAGKPNVAAKENTGKYTADTADYQNWARNPQNTKFRPEPPTPAASADGAGGTSPTTGAGQRTGSPSTAGAPVNALAGAIAHNQKQKQFVDAAFALRQEALAAGVKLEESQTGYGLFRGSEDQFKKDILENRTDFETALAPYRQQLLTKPGLESAAKALLAYDAAKGLAGGVKFDRALHLDANPETPYVFDGPEYSPTGDIGIKRAAIAEISKRYPFLTPPLDHQLHDKDFKATLTKLHSMRDIAGAILGTGSDPHEIAAAKQSGALNGFSDDEIGLMASEPTRIDDAIEDTHRSWRLNNAAIEAQDKNVNQMLNTPMGQAGEVHTPKAPSTIGPPVRTIEQKEQRTKEFQEAIDRLSVRLQYMTDEDPKAVQAQDLIIGLKASLDEPHSANAQSIWNKFVAFETGKLS